MVTSPQVQAVLDGLASYDDLTGEDQALVRAVWDARDAVAIQRLDFTSERPDRRRG